MVGLHDDRRRNDEAQRQEGIEQRRPGLAHIDAEAQGAFERRQVERPFDIDAAQHFDADEDGDEDAEASQIEAAQMQDHPREREGRRERHGSGHRAAPAPACERVRATNTSRSDIGRASMVAPGKTSRQAASAAGEACDSTKRAARPSTAKPSQDGGR